MSSMKTPGDLIDRRQRRRARIMTVQALFFLLWQVNFFSSPHTDFEHLRTVDHVKISAFIVWALVLLLLIATGGGWWDSRETRALMQDETTVAHRHAAIRFGYWAGMAGALGLYVASLFTQVRLVEAVHLILSLGVAAPLLRFAQLERRALRG